MDTRSLHGVVVVGPQTYFHCPSQVWVIVDNQDFRFSHWSPPSMRSNWPVNWLRFVLNCSPCLGRTVLKAWLFFAVPNLRMGNGTVQLLEKLLGVAAGVEKAVVLADPVH